MPIAKGKYIHYEGGQTNGIIETWEFKTSSHLEMRFETPTYQLLATIEYDAQERACKFEYHVDENVNGIYQVHDKQLHAKRTLPRNTKLDDILVWSESVILDLPFLSCKARTILYINQHGTIPTYAPHLWVGDRAGDLAKKSVEYLGEELLVIADTSYQATKYRYRHIYWLDEYGIVLKVEADNYEMVLTEYTRFD